MGIKDKYTKHKNFRVVMTVVVYNGNEEVKWDREYMKIALKNIINSHMDMECSYIDIKEIE